MHIYQHIGIYKNPIFHALNIRSELFLILIKFINSTVISFYSTSHMVLL